MPFASAVMALFPAPPKSMQSTPVAVAPEPAQPAIGLTAEAKQAMIASLQLDITEKARRLRQQYNEQAQQLRTRLERRLNRLPPRMRSKTMGQLAEEHERSLEIKAAEQEAAQRQPPRPLKRSSTHAFANDDDKENDSSTGLQSQKKRTKLTKPAIVPMSARKVDTQTRKPTNVLSPRSHNSRAFSRSPVKLASPEKARPISSIGKPRTAPVKPAPACAPSRAVSRAATTTGRKPAAKKVVDTDSSGRDSESSATSAVTTIIKKTTASKRAAPTKKAPAKPAASTTRKRAPAASKKEIVPAPTRTLRSRN